MWHLVLWHLPQSWWHPCRPQGLNFLASVHGERANNMKRKRKRERILLRSFLQGASWSETPPMADTFYSIPRGGWFLTFQSSFRLRHPPFKVVSMCCYFLWPQKYLLQRDLHMLHNMICHFDQLFKQTIWSIYLSSYRNLWNDVKQKSSTSNQLFGNTSGWKEEKDTAIENISLFIQVFVSSAQCKSFNSDRFSVWSRKPYCLKSFCILTLARFLDRARLDCQQARVYHKGFQSWLRNSRDWETWLAAHPK